MNNIIHTGVGCDMKLTDSCKTNFVRGNNVYILGDFDKTISGYVIPDFLELVEGMAGVKDGFINIYINSHGGYCSELLGLLTIIQMAKARGIRIDTYNMGIAYSCGSMLAIMGDVRYMYRYATNLPHLGTAGIDAQTIEQLNRGTKHINEWFSTILDMYIKNTKMSKKQLEKILKDDQYYMDAAECHKFGFCDEII